MRRALALLLAAGCLAPSACSSGATDTDDEPPRSGRPGAPLSGLSGQGWTAKNLVVGWEVTDGQQIIFNDGDIPIRLISVEPEITGNGLTYLGSLVLPPGRNYGSTQTFPHWPPRTNEGVRPAPVEGFVLDRTDDLGRRQGYEILSGYRLTAAGRSTVRSYRVTYEVEGDQRTQKFLSTISACTSAVCQPEYADP